MTRTARALLAFAVLTCVSGCGQEDVRPQRQVANEALRLRAARVAEELTAIGWPVDIAELTIEYRSIHRGVEPTPPTAPLISAAAWKHFADTILNVTDRPWPDVPMGYYAPDRRAVVLFHGGFGDLLVPDAVIAHELIHAYQHQVRERFGDESPRTTEAHNVEACLLEGEAQIGAFAFIAAQRGIESPRLESSGLQDALEQGVTGTFQWLPYDFGRAYLTSRSSSGARLGVDRCFDAPPRSTEQIIHPRKAADAPGTIAWPSSPPSGWTLEGEDVLGELFVHSWLALFHGRGPAHLAATGWDADRLRLYVHPDMGRVAVWVLAFDRAADAIDFSSRAREATTARVTVDDRRVIVVGAHGEGADALIEWTRREALAPPPDEADARSTAAEEAAWRKRHRSPTVEAQVWKLPMLGLSVPVPPTFEQRLVRGAFVLEGEGVSKFAPSIAIDTLELGSRLSIEEAKAAVAARTRDDVLQRVMTHEVLELPSGQQAVLAEHAVSDGGRWYPFRLLSLFVPTDRGAVLVSAAVHHEDRKYVWSEVERALRGVRLAEDGER